jgi:hypothetical protein
MNTIPNYINDWFTIIENMHNDNTYKLAWGNSIVQCCQSRKAVDLNGTITIAFEEIALNVLRYYWNQTFFFNLKQGSNINKPPVILQLTQKAIEKYCDMSRSNIPIWFDIGVHEIKKDTLYYNDLISKVAAALKPDVCYRFKRVLDKDLDIYRLNREKSEIYLTGLEVKMINDYSYVLSQLLNYKWTQLLEKFNNAPRIASKVKGARETALRRSNLSKFKEILLEQYKDGTIIDFYSGDALSLDDVSVDHVIPWSFMYSDDIWNLVITSKSYNSIKSNSIPSSEIIEKLKERNKQLLEIINEASYKEELEVAIKENYVEKFWISARK